MRIRRPVAAVLLALAGGLLACGDGGGAPSEPKFVLSEIVMAGPTSCGLTPGSSLYCWGKRLTSFGFCANDCALRPEMVLDSSRLVLHGLAPGFEGAVCGIDPIGSPRCGGYLLVDIDQAHAFSDTFDLLASGTTISSLAVGQGHICGIGPGGTVNCWGDHDGARRGDYGPNLGTGSDFVPNTVPGSFSTVSATFSATCGIEIGSRRILCWGYDSLLGSPAATVDSSLINCGFFAPCTPTPAAAETVRLFSTVVSGNRHSCGLEAAGAVYCWGFNDFGQVGGGDTAYAPVPVAVTLHAKAVRLAAGGSTTCAILTTDELYCWGALAGLAGSQGPANADAPFRIPINQIFVALAVTSANACGLTAQGEAYCWGNNSEGQLGTGDLLPYAKPVPVKQPLPAS